MGKGSELSDVKGVFAACELRQVSLADGLEADWGLETLLGRFVEVSSAGSTAALTVVVRVMLEAQQRGELAAWVTSQTSIFFPPDLAACGVDLRSLPVVRVEKPYEVVKSAETLLRSGGFALVVIDLGMQQSMSLAVQTRLAGLARRYQAVLLALTREQSHCSSLGSLVAVRVESSRQRSGFSWFECALKILRDKRSQHGRNSRRNPTRRLDRCRGPDDLC